MFAIILKQIKQVAKDEGGAAALEYGLIAAGIALALVTVITPIGTSLSGVFSRISAALPAATGG